MRSDCRDLFLSFTSATKRFVYFELLTYSQHKALRLPLIRFLADSLVHTQGVALLLERFLWGCSLGRNTHRQESHYFGFVKKMGAFITKGPSSGQGVAEVAVVYTVGKCFSARSHWTRTTTSLLPRRFGNLLPPVS
jgi:hypothetical protein